jgi:hypothetical protein
LFVFRSKRESGSERNLSANDRVTTHEIHAGVEQMHRSALPFRTPGRFAVKFRHDRFGRDALGDRLAVFAVTGDDVIVPAKSGNRTNSYGFLADVEMAEPANLAHAVGFSALLFEAPNQQHLVKHPEQGLAVIIE